MDILKSKWLWLALLALLVGGGISLWYLNRDSEEAAVRATLRDLCRITSKPEGEGNAAAALKINRTDRVFAPVCSIDFRHEVMGGDYTPVQLTAMLARARGLFQHYRVATRDIAVTVQSEERASAVFTGLFDGRLNDGSTVSEVRDLYCTLEKIDGSWLIRSISVHDVLEK